MTSSIVAVSGELPADWQEAPTKGEWKSLAKLYGQRRLAGESAEALGVLAEGLAASGSKAARKVLETAAAAAAAVQ